MNRILIALLVALALSACGVNPTPRPSPQPQPNTSQTLRIVAASEVKLLEDAGILREFTTQTGIALRMQYKGSVDIRNMITAYSAKNPGDVDIFWAASPLWMSSFVRDQTSTMRTYVVLGVDPKMASEFGWGPQKGIQTTDVIDAMRTGKLKLAIPSATQDDAGALFYLSTLSSLKGGILVAKDLSDTKLAEEVKALFTGISRSAATSDGVKQLFLEDRRSTKNFNAVVLPEAVLIDLNRQLGSEPLTIFYVIDAVGLQTFPLGYVDRSSQAVVDAYNKLTSYLKSPAVKEKLKARGWRVGYVGMKVSDPDPNVFNPSWGVQTDVDFPPAALPKEDVIDAALNQYQLALRKPSYTLYCLDYSGSMAGDGERQMKDAMDLLLDQSRAAAVLLQATPKDTNVVIRFDTGVGVIASENGNDPSGLKEVSKRIAGQRPDGSTAMFSCVQEAIAKYAGTTIDSSRNYAVIVLTDGQSNAGTSMQAFLDWYPRNGRSIPVYGIAFGGASFEQLNAFLKTGGTVCDGRRGGDDLLNCFRKAKGSN